MMITKKSVIVSNISILLSFGIILIASSSPLFQANTNLFNNNFYFSFNNMIQFVYAQDEYDGNDKDDDDDDDRSTDDKSNSKKNKNIVKDDNKNSNHQQPQDIVLVADDLTCQSQSAEVIQLNGIIIKPKGIRLLADFNPCQLSNGKLTLYIPITPLLKLGVMYIDYSNGNSTPAGILVSPTKLQSIDTIRGIFTAELDGKMKGKEPVTKEDTTLSNINGLALYNSGDKPLEFKDGDVAILKATFTK